MAKAKKVKLGGKKEVKKAPRFVVSLGYNEKVVELKGDSLEQLFLNYQPEPFKSLINLKVTVGKQVVERLWPIMKARRVFNNHNNAAIEASLLEKLFT